MRLARLVAVLAVLVAAVAVALLTKTERAADQRAAAERTGGAERASEKRARRSTGIEEGRSVERGKSEEGPGTGAFTVPGRVRYLGTGERPERVTARVVSMHHGWEANIEVVEGRFELSVPGPGEYRFGSVVVDGEKSSYQDTLTLTPGKGVEVALPLMAEATLRVVDARDGHGLAGVRVYERHDRLLGLGLWQVPEEATLDYPRRLTKRDGRVVLRERGSEKSPWFAGIRKQMNDSHLLLYREGYAWKPVVVPVDVGGEVRVALHRGGSLRVRVAGWRELEDGRVLARMLEPGTRSKSEQRRSVELPAPDETGTLLAEGLQEGLYEISVLSRGWEDRGTVEGRGEAQVVAGKVAEAVIELIPHRGRLRTAVAVTLQVPAGWKQRSVTLQIIGYETWSEGLLQTVFFEAPKSAAPVAVEIEPLPPGRYLVQVRSCGWGTMITVPDRGGRFDLAVPEPARVEVRVVDAASGREVAEPKVHWSYVVTDEETIRSGFWDWQNPSTGEIAFQVPAGRVKLEVRADGYIEGAQELTAVGGVVYTVTQRLERVGAGVLIVRVRLDGREFSGYGMDATLTGGSEPWMRFQRGGWRAKSVAPGKYRLELAVTEGIEPVPAREVEIAAGKTTELVIDLKRKR